MSISHKIFTNTVWQIGSRLADVFLGVLTLALVTRYLGQEQFGHFTTINAWLQVFAIIVDLGLYLTLLRQLATVSKEEQPKLINAIFSLRLITAAIILLTSIGIVWATPYPLIVKQGVTILALSYCAASLITVLTAIFQYNLHMRLIAVSSTVQKIITLLLTVAAIAYWPQSYLLPLLWVTVAATMIQLMIVIGAVQKISPLRFVIDRKWWQRILLISWPIALTTALNLVYFKMDTVILSWYRPAAEVGLYGASYRVLEIITTFPHMFMGLILAPLTAAWVAKDSDRLRSLWQRSWEFFALIVMPLITGGFVLAEPVMVLIAGPEFIGAAPILQILLLATGAIFFGVLFTYMVLVVGRQKALIPSFIVAAIGAILAYIYFIPLYGMLAAAWITVIIEIFIALAAWKVTAKEYVCRPPLISSLKILAASLLMAVVLASLPISSVLIQILVGVTLYGILLFAFRALRWSEINHLLSWS